LRVTKEKAGPCMVTKLYPDYPDADRPTVFDEALKFQDFIVDLMIKEVGIAMSNYCSKYYQHNIGENRQGIEIKYDRRILETGNVSIEVAEKSRADIANWTNSGILREDNSWLYIQGNYDIVLIFGKEILKRLYYARYIEKVWEPKKTIKTFLMKLDDAKKYALKVIYP
jgi:hypothetical protein